MNPSADSEAKLLLEVPYEPKLWKLAAMVFLLSGTQYVGFVAFTHESSGPSVIRGFVVCIAALSAFPLVVCVATLVVTCFVRRTLKLTTAEISAPRTGFALQNTVVPLRDIERISVRPTGDKRYLDIYYSAGRLGIAESWFRSSDAFEKVLAAVGGAPCLRNRDGVAT